MKKDSKAANSQAIILGALIISYLPLTIFFLVAGTFPSDTLKPSVIAIFLQWAPNSIMLGSLVNPIIIIGYCWRIKKLPRAFLEICHLRQPENKAPNIDMIGIERHRPEIQASTWETFSMAVANQEPVLFSFSHLQAEDDRMRTKLVLVLIQSSWSRRYCSCRGIE